MQPVGFSDNALDDVDVDAMGVSPEDVSDHDPDRLRAAPSPESPDDATSSPPPPPAPGDEEQAS
jgi:hypothetical protein